MRPLFTIFGVAVSVFSAHAQTSLSNDSTAAPVPASTLPNSFDEPDETLESLLQLAIQNNPQPQIARANIEAARARERSLRSLSNPVLQIVPAAFGDRESRDEEILLSQPLDVFGQRRAERRVLEAQTRRALADAELAQFSLQLEVKRAAAGVFAAQETETLESAQLEIARQFREAASRRAELGEIPFVQAQRAALEFSRAQNSLEVARAEKLAQRALLNQLLGRDAATPFRVVLSLASTDSLAPGFSVSAPHFARPELASAQANLDANRADLAALSRARFPQFELQARRGGVFDDAKTSLRAVISLPLFDFGTLKNQKRAAQAGVRAQELQIQSLRSQIAAQYEAARVRAHSQREIARRYREVLVPQTLDLLRKTQIGFAQGASTYLEILEAQRTARQTQTEYLQALVGAFEQEILLQNAAPSPPNPSEIAR